MSHPIIHPMDVELEVLAEQPHGVRLNDVPGKPSTRGGLVLHSVQFIFAVIALAVLASADFTSESAFCLLIAAAGLQCLWSFPLLLMDLYALAKKRRLRDPRLVRLFTVGDGIIGLLLLIAASASGGITNQICNELVKLKPSEIEHCVWRVCNVEDNAVLHTHMDVEDMQSYSC